MTRSRGAQLLGELLLDRANVKVMMRYVGDPANLKLMMILLKDSSRSIQFEAFHVFKAGPHAVVLCIVLRCSSHLQGPKPKAQGPGITLSRHTPGAVPKER